MARVNGKFSVDDELLRAAKELGNHETLEEAATAALEEYIRYHRQLQLLELEGEIDYEDGDDGGARPVVSASRR